MALLEPERLGAIELYAVDDPEPQIRKDRAILRIRSSEFRSHMDRNEPCLIEGIGRDWGLREYVTDGVPDLAKLAETYGTVEVPVQDAGVAKMMPLSHFARVWREKIDEGRRYYLKDWHFRLDGLGDLAPVPEIFADDWLSGARDMDYHFVYLSV